MNKGGYMEKNIVLARDFDDNQIQRIKSILTNHELAEKINDQTEIILGWNQPLIDQLDGYIPPSLQWIQSHTAGVDQFPHQALKEAGVTLTNAKGIHKEVIGETVFAILLAYQRQVLYAAQHQNLEELKHSQKIGEILGKTVLIIGTGSIGQYLGQLSKVFGMNTIGINRSGHAVEGMDQVYAVDEIDRALAQADIVINILPLTAATQHFYDLNLFKQMKEQTIFINVGRGESVCEEDLLQAIEQGIISFAGLDVFEEEPLPSDHPFWQEDQILVLPHIAGSREDYLKHVIDIFEKNYQEFIQEGQPKENVVNLQTGY